MDITENPLNLKKVRHALNYNSGQIKAAFIVGEYPLSESTVELAEISEKDNEDAVRS